ncbi:MAG: Rrf2 family transcriptional regulator [Clostridia bacterium]|nr:Rrf2 family transcriptional regulator [Clostridia bacterium]
MRITQESDYALRILTALATEAGVVDAKTLSAKTSVTQRFTLKILNKLVGDGIVSSYKGAKGGYKLRALPEQITLRRVIELIDGPIVLARCLGESEECSLNQDKGNCIYHHIFERISLEVAGKLGRITIADVIARRFSL